MIEKIVLYVYSGNLLFLCLFSIVFVYIWCFVGNIIVKRHIWWIYVNRILLIFAMYVIMYITLLSREPGTSSTIVFTPFYSFAAARQCPELYREMFMNVLLFMPLGIFLPFSTRQWETRWRNTIINYCVMILLIILFSALIEYFQFITGCGNAEVDDIMCNTIGGIIGLLGYYVSGIFY